MEKGILLSAKNIDKSFQIEGVRQKVIDNVSLDVNMGEFVCLVGPSGCGKSTYLRLISGLMKPDSGTVTTAEGIKLAFVFQNFALFPWLTVKENIAFGLRMQNLPEEKIEKEVADRIKQINLDGFEDKHPKELSGGMKQRVGIARALAVKPNLLILDEPFSALDTQTAQTLRQDLLDIWKKDQLTVLMVSHLIEEAVELADRVLVFEADPGRIKKEVIIGLKRPRDNRSKEFFSYVDKISDLIETS